MAQATTKVPEPSQGVITLPDLASQANRNERLIYYVLIIALISLGAVIVGGITLVLDQMHFNNEFYREGAINHTHTVVKTDFTPTPAAFSNPLALPKK
jgi:hypothetical protein